MIKRILKGKGTKAYTFSFLGNLFSSASQWVVLMLLSKMYGTVQMGQYALALAWILPLYAFFSLQIRNIHVADQTNVYGFNVFFGIRLISIAAFFCTTLLIGFIFYRNIFIVFLLGGLFKSFEMTSDMIHAEFHKRKLIITYSKMLIFRSVLAIVFNLLFFRLIPSYQWALVSLPAAYLCSMLIDIKLITNLKVSLKPDLKNPAAKKFAATGILTGLSLLLVYLLPGIPRFILEKFRDSFDVGIISGYLSLVIFSRIFVQAIVQNSLPVLAGYYDSLNINAFLSVLKKEALLVTILGALQFVLVPFSNILFPIIFNADFASRQGLLAVIFAGSLFGFLAFVLNNGINAMKLFRVQLPVYASLTVLSIVSGYLLIPLFGLYGAAYTFVIVNICACILLFIPFMSNINRSVKKARAAKPAHLIDNEHLEYKVIA